MNEAYLKAIVNGHCDEDLDILVNDEDPDVRKAVAERGRDKDLDILVNDKNCSVRKAVAERENFNEHPSAAEEVEVPSDFMSYVDAVIEEVKQERQALSARQIKPTIMQGDEH